tara:strand:+ start:1037 stop:1540 length:504 start_codon:yes stop_codon:yes gene_type:complete
MKHKQRKLKADTTAYSFLIVFGAALWLYELLRAIWREEYINLIAHISLLVPLFIFAEFLKVKYTVTETEIMKSRFFGLLSSKRPLNKIIKVSNETHQKPYGAGLYLLFISSKKKFRWPREVITLHFKDNIGDFRIAETQIADFQCSSLVASLKRITRENIQLEKEKS